MSASRFWALTDSEIRINPGKGGGKTGGKTGGKGGGKGGKGGGNGGGRGKGGGWSGGGPAGGGGSAPGPAALEILDMTDFTAVDEIIFTDIDGIDIADFSFIMLRGNSIVASGDTGTPLIRIQVSDDAGDTWIDAYHYSEVNSNIGPNGVIDGITLKFGNDPWSFDVWIENFNSDGPTGIACQETDYADSFTTRYTSMTDVGARHNAIRVFLDSSGTVPKFTTGTLEIIGYRTPKAAETQVRDFSTDSGTEWFVDIPSGHSIANIFMADIVQAGTDHISVQASVAGTPISGASDYMQSIVDKGSSLNTARDRIIATSDEATNGWGSVSVWNLGMAVPLSFRGSTYLKASTAAWLMGATLVVPTPIAYTQLRIFSDGGTTITSGKIYVQTYNPETTVLLEHDFALLGPVGSVDVTGITPENGSCVMLGSRGLTNGGKVRARVQVEGVTDVAAGDYIRQRIQSNGNESSLQSDGFHLNENTGNGQHFALISGMPHLVRSHCVESHEGGLTDFRAATHSTRDKVQVEDGLRFLSNGGTFSAGILYGIGYAM